MLEDYDRQTAEQGWSNVWLDQAAEDLAAILSENKRMREALTTVLETTFQPGKSDEEQRPAYRAARQALGEPHECA